MLAVCAQYHIRFEFICSQMMGSKPLTLTELRRRSRRMVELRPRAIVSARPHQTISYTRAIELSKCVCDDFDKKIWNLRGESHEQGRLREGVFAPLAIQRLYPPHTTCVAILGNVELATSKTSTLGVPSTTVDRDFSTAG